MEEMKIDVEEIARRMAPKIRFHPDEQFYPCSVDWFLNRCSIVTGAASLDYSEHNINFQLPPEMKLKIAGPLSADKLYGASNSTAFGGGEIDGISLFPMAAAPGTQPSYSRKGYFTNYQLDTLAGQRVNGTINAPCYVRITRVEMDTIRLLGVDLPSTPYFLISYYFLCAYNGAMGGLSNRTAPMSPFTGGGGYYAHIGDWMRLSARVRVNGDRISMEGVEFEAHGETTVAKDAAHSFTDKTLDALPRLLAYSAWHSHELYPSAKTDWKLPDTDLATDATADGGTEWDTAKQLVMLDEQLRDPAQKWIFYNGLWGANINIDQTLIPEIEIKEPITGIHIKTISATTVPMQKNGPSGPAFKRDWNRGTQYRPPLLGGRAFDPAFYLSIYGDLKNAFGIDQTAARCHWATMGLPKEGRRGSRGLDVGFYLRQYPDLQAAFGQNYAAALDHWSLMGLPTEGRRAAFEFDPRFYLGAYADLTAAFGTDYGAALDHWLIYGLNEGRRTAREFDIGFYVSQYPDLQAAFGTNYRAALEHWLTFGISEGRRTSRDFDAAFYLSYYPDLQAAFGPANYAAAISHWFSFGLKEGRRSALEFDVGFYMGSYPDLKAAFGTDNGAAFDHWRVHGLNEGRRASREFDVSYYVGAYPDLEAAFGTDHGAALNHWRTQGLPKEGRRGSKDFDVGFYLNNYPDLKAAFGTNYGAAMSHWLSQGSPKEHREGAAAS
jgi:hypothetical protein